MISVLISFYDPILSDVVSTAFKQFPAFTSYRLPPEEVCEMVRSDQYDAVIVGLDRGDEHKAGLVKELRSISKKIEIIGMVDRSDRDKFNRFKLENGVFSLVPLPLDPFSFAKTISRLEAKLRKSSLAR